MLIYFDNSFIIHCRFIAPCILLKKCNKDILLKKCNKDIPT
jgi:hypothetical protein